MGDVLSSPEIYRDIIMLWIMQHQCQVSYPDRSETNTPQHLYLHIDLALRKCFVKKMHKFLTGQAVEKQP